MKLFRAEFSFPDKRRLLLAAAIVFAYIVIYTLLIFLFNRGVPNHILTPLPQYFSLFSALWDENAWAAIQLMIKKSFFVITHKDPRSGLNLWTMEIDTITFCIYVIVAWILSGRLLALRNQAKQPAKAFALFSAIAGSSLIFLSISYMSVIAHCAGPTWVGFVALYGMGASEFELYPAYQIATATAGCALLLLSLYLGRSISGSASHTQTPLSQTA